jgi:hypothetical protein
MEYKSKKNQKREANFLRNNANNVVSDIEMARL